MLVNLSIANQGYCYKHCFDIVHSENFLCLNLLAGWI